MTNEKNKPTNIKIGAVQVAIWTNTSKKGNTFQTAQLTRSYKDGDEWKQTNNLNANDIPKAILALNKAYEHIVTTKNETNEE